ncbi:MAG: Fpg/Nei family DNA glycosylase [Planctomycetota bacterium]|jgi:formamidopyrimidine-DNA glycosylase
MPELPEVAGYKRILDATSLHQTIQSVSIPDGRIVKGVSPQTVRRRVKGSQLEQTHRHGKFLFAKLSRGGWLMLHFGMTGRPEFVLPGAPMPRHAKLLLTMENGRLVFRCPRLLGKVSFTETVEEVVQASRMGPDALADDLTAEAFISLLDGRRGTIKPLLLNQSLVAGIGNIWADEILYQVGLHPATPVDRLDQRQRRRVYQTMRRILTTAVRANGDDNLPRRYLVRHRRRDGVCPSCRNDLTSATIGGRTAWFCAHCQK